MTDIIERHAVRGLIVSPSETVLLAQMHLSNRTFWVTPGGGIESGEEILAALERELAEEVGEFPWEIGPEIWLRSHRFNFEGDEYLQHERFFLVKAPKFSAPARMNDEEEQRFFGQYRWWTLSGIASSDEVFAPGRLAHFLADILDGVIPESPIDIGR